LALYWNRWMRRSEEERDNPVLSGKIAVNEVVVVAV